MNIITTILLGLIYFISLFFAIFWLLVFLTKNDIPKQKKMKTLPRITVAIPAFNEEASIQQTIASVIALDYPKNKIEIIIINDGSTDATAEKVKQVIAEYTQTNVHPNFNSKIILLNQKNAGKGAALNNAIKHASGKYFICLDADSFVEKNALKKMLPYFSSPEIAAVIPMLKVKDPKNLLQRLQWYEYVINMFYKELMGKLDCVHVVPGPFSVYDKKILQKIGGFEEHNMTEDLEIAFRLQSKHYRIIQLLNTEVLTLAPETMDELVKQRNRWFKGATINAYNYKNMLFNKKYGDFGMIQVPSVLFSGVIAIILFFTLIYYAVKPYVLYFYHMGYVHFDFFTMLRDFTINFQILDLNFFSIFMAVVMFIVTMYVLKNSIVATQERFFKYGSITIFFYLFFYFLLLGVIWAKVFGEMLIGKKQRW